MAELPEPPTPTLSAIYASYEARQGDGFRDHLGASLIGKSCARALWYDFRWATPARHTGRILRLFETGQLEEARLVRDLRATGATVLEVDPETGRQFRVEAHGEVVAPAEGWQVGQVVARGLHRRGRALRALEADCGRAHPVLRAGAGQDGGHQAGIFRGGDLRQRLADQARLRHLQQGTDRTGGEDDRLGVVQFEEDIGDTEGEGGKPIPFAPDLVRRALGLCGPERRCRALGHPV